MQGLSKTLNGINIMEYHMKFVYSTQSRQKNDISPMQ